MSSSNRKRKEKVESDDEDNSKRRRYRPSLARAALDDVLHRPISYIASICIFSYVAIFLIQRISSDQETFWDSWYDLLFLCNSALIMGAFGMLFRSPLLIGISMASVAFSHTAYIYDLVVWTFLDQYTLGRTLFFENVALGEAWFTTLHQFWYLPLCFAVLYCDYRSFGLATSAYFYSWLINIGMSAFAYIHYSQPTGLNQTNFVPSFNVAHEYITEDAELIHRGDAASFFSFLIWRFLVESVLLNGVFFFFLKSFSVILIERGSASSKEKVK